MYNQCVYKNPLFLAQLLEKNNEKISGDIFVKMLILCIEK